MSSAKSKAISEVNLEEFERRLRAAGAPQVGVEDPLSELTRLVNTIDSERPRTEKVVDIASARMPKSEPFPSAPQLQRETQAPSRSEGSAPPSPPVAQSSAAAPVAPPARVAPAAPLTPPARVVPAARVAPAARVLKPAVAAAPAALPNRSAPTLRGSFDETPTPATEHRDSGERAIAAETREEEAPAHEYFAQAPLEAAGERITLARPLRAGSWYLKVAGLTAVALLMVGGAVAMKIGVPRLHGSPPLILAADGPSKIAPPNEATVQSAGDTGALLLKDSAAPTPSPVKLVSTEEQPVDLLAQTPAPAPAPKAPAADAQSAPAPIPSAADGQSAPAPKSPAADGQLAPAPNTPIVAPSEGLGGPPASDRALFPSAKRVKTVSVRPDGTLISSDTVPDAPIAQSPAPAPSPAPVAPARKSENAGAAALAATPTIELPAKPAPKSSARVNLAKTDASAPADANSPLQLGPPAAHARKLAKTPKPKPAVVADATPAAAETDATPKFETAPAGGGWAVQLAGARSESEAQATLSRLQSKYSGDLGSASLSVHKAEVNGDTVYRVRAGGLSKADAHSLCTKLKASGGDCFVARNN
jgi:SPOR domain